MKYWILIPCGKFDGGNFHGGEYLWYGIFLEGDNFSWRVGRTFPRGDFSYGGLFLRGHFLEEGGGDFSGGGTFPQGGVLLLLGGAFSGVEFV